MDTRNAFAELGLEPGATAHEVKAAWRRLVSHWHPDRNPSDGALVRMQRINDAFRIVRQALGAGHEVPSHDEAPASSAREPAAEDARARTEGRTTERLRFREEIVTVRKPCLPPHGVRGSGK